MFWQLLVRATRQSIVTIQSATATVTVRVLRNENGPVFVGNYVRSMDENSPLGSSVVQLLARDNDTKVKIFMKKL